MKAVELRPGHTVDGEKAFATAAARTARLGRELWRYATSDGRDRFLISRADFALSFPTLAALEAYINALERNRAA